MSQLHHSMIPHTLKYPKEIRKAVSQYRRLSKKHKAEFRKADQLYIKLENLRTKLWERHEKLRARVEQQSRELVVLQAEHRSQSSQATMALLAACDGTDINPAGIIAELNTCKV